MACVSSILRVRVLCFKIETLKITKYEQKLMGHEFIQVSLFYIILLITCNYDVILKTISL